MKEISTLKKHEILEEDFEKALGYHRQGLYEDAALGYQKILTDHGDHKPSLLNLGVVYYVKSSYDLAMDNFQKALELDGSDVDALYNLGRTLQACKEFSRSLEYLKKAHELNSADGMILKSLGRGYFELGFYEEACSTLQKYLEKEPDDLEALMQFSDSKIQLGRFDVASFGLKRLIDLDAGCERAYELLADCYSHQNRTEKSVEVLERLLKVRPNDSALYRKLAIYHGQLKDYSEARRCYRNAYSLESKGLKFHDPAPEQVNVDIDRITFQNSILSITEKYSARSDWKGALNEFTRLSKRYPDSVVLLQEIAYIYQLTGQPKRAASYYEKIHGIDPENLESMLQLVRIAIDSEEFGQGTVWIERALELYPSVMEVFELAGQLHVSSQEYDIALKYFRRCKAESFDTCGVMLGSSQCHMGRNEFAQARKILSSAVRIFPDSVELALNLARCYLEEGSVKDAQELMKRTSKLFASNIQVQALSVQVAVAAGNYRRATEIWSQIAGLVPREKEDFTPFIKSLVAIRDQDLALRYLKSYTRFRHKNFEQLYLESLIHATRRDRVRFSIPWQELWCDHAQQMVASVFEIKSILDKGDIEFLVTMQKELHHLFTTRPEMLKALEEFFRMITQPITLEVVK
jgi:tetratricopeptide (TPR) repeat protein